MSMLQKEIFLQSEGDSWFQRNAATTIKKTEDEILQTIQKLKLVPKKVLEIGCSDGKRLAAMQSCFQVEGYGIDPSNIAIDAGRKQFPNLSLAVGTADRLSFKDNAFDLIIFGFCLYVCDRVSLFKIAAEADRCLMNHGHLIIKDFVTSFPYQNSYSHQENIRTFKMDYAKMFLWNPAYQEIYRYVWDHSGGITNPCPDKNIAINVMVKNEDFAYVNEPFKGYWIVSKRITELNSMPKQFPYPNFELPLAQEFRHKI